MNRIKVIVVDDQPIVRDGIKMILSLSDQIEVLFAASNGFEALEYCMKNSVDIVLMDIRMPIMDGVEATKRIKENCRDVKIIILTTFNDDKYIFDALKYGASSYLLKDVESEELINTIKMVYMGGTFIHKGIAQKLVDNIEGKKDVIQGLTQREIEISKLIAKGHSNKEIADSLCITEGTVKNHVTNIMSKLGLSHRTKIALYVIENKL